MFHTLEENANNLGGNFGFDWTFIRNIERTDDGVLRTKNKRRVGGKILKDNTRAILEVSISLSMDD